MNFKRLVTFICLSLLISGCATLDILTLSASGISYLISGKSISDNIVSAWIDEDCAVHRMLLNKQICVPTNMPVNDAGTRIAANSTKNVLPVQQLPVEQSPAQPLSAPYRDKAQQLIAKTIKRSNQLTEVLVAKTAINKGHAEHSSIERNLIEDTGADLTMLSSLEIAANSAEAVIDNQVVRGAEFVSSTSSPGTNTRSTNTLGTNTFVSPASLISTTQRQLKNESEIVKTMTPAQGTFSDGYIENPQTFVVIGSFNELIFARERQISHLALNAEVISNINNDQTKFRVVVGPYNEFDTEQSLVNLPELEKFSPWRINLCASTMAAPPCESSVLARVDF